MSGLAGQTAPPRKVSGLACMIGERTHADLVGAYLCVRPCTKVARLQRADTSVGPYRGYKRILCFGGVANVRFVQRAGHAPPLQRNGFVFWWDCDCMVRAAVEASLDPT